jgi:stage III sporulation protein AH
MNKKNLWFLTLFSLIIVLSIYYITMPTDLMIEEYKEEETAVSEEIVEEDSVLVSLRVEAEEEYLKELESLKTVLNNADSTVDEKNNAFEQIKQLSNIKGEQEKLEEEIQNNIGAEAFVRIEGNKITVVVNKKEHDTKLANQIMRLVQSNYKNKMYITVKFQSSK